MGLLGDIGGFFKRAFTPPSSVRSVVSGAAAKAGRVFTPVNIKRGLVAVATGGLSETARQLKKPETAQLLSMIPHPKAQLAGAVLGAARRHLQPIPPEPAQPLFPVQEGEHGGGIQFPIALGGAEYGDPFRREPMPVGPRAGLASPATSAAHQALRIRSGYQRGYRKIPRHIARKYGEGDLGEEMAARGRKRRKKRRSRRSLNWSKLSRLADVLCAAKDIVRRPRRRYTGGAPTAYDIYQDRREARRGPSMRRRRRRGKKMSQATKDYLRSLRRRR